MIISTKASNRIAFELANAGSFIAGTACAGSALGPIGAAGGTLFGATSCVPLCSANRVCKKIFNLDDPGTSLVAKVVAFAIQLFAMAGSGMVALTFAGFTITLGSTVSLTLLSTIGFLFVNAILEFCCGDLKAPVN